MRKSKFLSFKVNEVACESCNKTYKVNTYKNSMPVPKKLPKSHLPEHKCGDNK